ncbi:erythromycin esterase family protein [Flavihumibacter sp. R14]|nr:erythromycin esterase family protein [Flavihumibacter soli]
MLISKILKDHILTLSQLLLSITLSCLSVSNCIAQNNNALKFLDSIAIPLQLGPDASLINPALYESCFKNKDLIALGESTHGTKEFNSYKAEIIRHLITNDKLKTIIFETEYCNVKKLNDFLLNGKSDSLLYAMSGLYGIYKTQEVYEMLTWIKNYNRSVESAQRIQIKGADMQDPYAITKSILENVKDLNLLKPASFDRLNKLHKLYAPAKEIKHSKEDFAAYKEMINDLYHLVNQDKSIESRQYVRLLEQTIGLRETSNFSQYRELRDKFLAENVIYLYQQKPVDSKIVLWAHNGHIAHAEVGKTHRMGYHLQKRLGDNYYAMAFAFDEGASRIYDFEGSPRGYKNFNYSSSVKSNSLEFALQKIKHPVFVLNLDDVQENPSANEYLSKARYMRVIGAAYLEPDSKNYFWFPVFESFDGIFFFQKASAAEGIKDKS